MILDAVVAWLQSTALSHAILVQTWIWPVAETVHFIGLALVVGIIGLLDLRLMGLFPTIPIPALRELVPFAIAGFLLNLGSGVIFLVGHPEQYAHNLSWWLKVLSLVIAGGNALVFELACAKEILALAPGARTPVTAKCVGAISLAAWTSVLFWGRMLPFIGDAF